MLIIKVLKFSIITLIKIYKIVISPWLGNRCRYIPTCSDYFMEAIKKHGMQKGIRLSVKRILSCRPGGNSGYDPVP